MFCVQDAGCQQVGFFLGSCGVQLALTSDTCFKALPRNANGELTSFKGTLSFFRVLSSDFSHSRMPEKFCGSYSAFRIFLLI